MARSVQLTRAAFGVSAASLYWFAWWVVEGSLSPLRNLFLLYPEVGQLLFWLSLPASFIGVVVSGNVHQPDLVVAVLAVSVQWFIVGWLVSVLALWVIARRRRAS
jgi:hypothetical protein